MVKFGKKIERFKCEDLSAVGIKSRSPIVEVSAPIIIVEKIYAIAIAIIGKGRYVLGWVDVVIYIDKSHISEIAVVPIALLSEASGAHLGGSVGAVRLGIHHLPTPLHLRRLRC